MYDTEEVDGPHAVLIALEGMLPGVDPKTGPEAALEAISGLSVETGGINEPIDDGADVSEDAAPIFIVAMTISKNGMEMTMSFFTISPPVVVNLIIPNIIWICQIKTKPKANHDSFGLKSQNSYQYLPNFLPVSKKARTFSIGLPLRMESVVPRM